MAKTKGSSGNFTYDFGIAIAQSTVNKVVSLAGASLTLASAFYSLQQIATEYVDTLKTNTLRFGGYLATIKTMEQAQNRLLKGLTTFSVQDQLEGMNKLRAAGINIRKDFEFYNKAAHASGKSFNEFATSVNSAIAGNLSGLVEMGLMTERAARRFQIYQGNTVMMQGAITNFLKSNKALAQAIQNDFFTIKDQMRRLGENWKFFMQSIVGKPNDPGSFYAQVVKTIKTVADAMARNGKTLRQWGFAIGQILGWVIRNIGHFILWIGKVVKYLVNHIWKTTDNYQQSVYKMIVVLEFWKVHIVNQFKEVLHFVEKHQRAFWTLLNILAVYKAMSMGISAYRFGVAGIRGIVKGWKEALALATRYRRVTGAGRAISWAAFMPAGLRKVWVATARALEYSFKNIALYVKVISMGNWKGLKMLVGLDFGWLLKPFIWLIRNIPTIIGMLEGVGSAIVGAFTVSNPVGWIILAISLLALLYAKVKPFRDFYLTVISIYWEFYRLLVNVYFFIVFKLMAGVKAAWNWIKNLASKIGEFFANIGRAIAGLWEAFMNTAVGNWMNENIFKPVVNFFKWLWGGVEAVGSWLKKWIWDPIVAAVTWLWDKISKITDALKGVVNWFKGINENLEASNTKTMNSLGIKGNAPALPSSDWIDKKLNWDDSKKTTTKPTTKSKNPIIVENKTPYFGSTSEKAPVTVAKGAITINVAKGSDIDENKLAMRIKKELMDIQLRDFNRRGGINNQIFTI